MATLQGAIKQRLSTDLLLTSPQPAGMAFVVWDRWLVKPTNFLKPEAGTTPEAFDAQAGGRMRRNIVILAGGENERSGSQSDELRRWDAFPRIYLFAEAHQNGKQAVEDAKLRIETLLCGWEAVITAGQRVSFRPADEVPLEDSELWPGNVVAIVRWRATGARRLPTS